VVQGSHEHNEVVPIRFLVAEATLLDFDRGQVGKSFRGDPRSGRVGLHPDDAGENT